MFHGSHLWQQGLCPSSSSMFLKQLSHYKHESSHQDVYAVMELKLPIRHRNLLHSRSSARCHFGGACPPTESPNTLPWTEDSARHFHPQTAPKIYNASMSWAPLIFHCSGQMQWCRNRGFRRFNDPGPRAPGAPK